MKKLLIGLLVALVIVTGIVVFTAPEKDAGGSTSVDHKDQTTVSHKCYVCGESGNRKYGSFYYCNVHYAMVKTVTEAGE